MGLNAEIWVLGEHPVEQVEKAEALFANRLPGFLLNNRIDVNPYGDSMLNLGGLGRYYGPGYERGNWPEIYAAIRLAQYCFPDSVVIYTPDSEIPDPDDEATSADELADIWRHWLGENGHAYYENYRAWRAARGDFR